MLLLSIELRVLAQVYQELCKKHPTFRERSENTDLAVRFAWACLVAAGPAKATLNRGWEDLYLGRQAPSLKAAW